MHERGLCPRTLFIGEQHSAGPPWSRAEVLVKVLPPLYCGLGTSPPTPFPPSPSSPPFSTHVHWAGMGFRGGVAKSEGRQRQGEGMEGDGQVLC